MARLYSNENFPKPVVESLRELGHDVLTTQDAGNADQAIPDEDVLDFAIKNGSLIFFVVERQSLLCQAVLLDKASFVTPVYPTISQRTSKTTELF